VLAWGGSDYLWIPAFAGFNQTKRDEPYMFSREALIFPPDFNSGNSDLLVWQRWIKLRYSFISAPVNAG